MTRVHLRCADLPARWRILNDRWSTVASGLGSDTVDLPAGLHVLRLTDAAPEVADLAFRVTDTTTKVAFEHPAPAWTTAGLDPTDAATTQRLALDRLRSANRAAGGASLIIAPLGDAFGLPAVSDAAARIHRTANLAIRATSLAPGSHTLRSPRSRRRSQPLFLPPGYDSLIFLPAGGDPAHAVHHLVPHGTSFADGPDRHTRALTELTHRALADRDAAIGVPMAQAITDLRDPDPLVVLMGVRLAYLSLSGTWGRWKRDRQPQVNELVHQLIARAEHQATGLPDLAVHHALRAAFEERRGEANAQPVRHLPLLADTWQTVLSASRDLLQQRRRADPDAGHADPLLGTDRRLGAIAAATIPEPLWTAWVDAGAQRLTPTDPALAARPGTLGRQSAEKLTRAASKLTDAPTLQAALYEAAFLRRLTEAAGLTDNTVVRDASASPAVLDIARLFLE